MTKGAVFAVGLAALLLGAGGAWSQPVDGDLIVGLTPSNPGLVLCIQPGSKVVTLLAQEPSGIAFSDLQMDTDNIGIVLGASDIRTPSVKSHVLRLSPLGGIATLSSLPMVAPGITHLELDHDAWVLAGWSFFSPQTDWLWGMPHGGGVITTFFGAVSNNPVRSLTIDRDPGSWPYMIMRGTHPSPAPWIQAMDRTSIVASLATTPWTRVGDIAFDARTGDYLVASYDVMRMSKQGAFTTLVKSTTSAASAVALRQDGTAWIAGFEVGSLIVYRIDWQGVVLSRMVFPQFTSASFTGFFVYGERRLVCAGSGKPGTQVAVRLQSRRPADAGKPYVLGCSFARRPGIPVGGANAIDLNPQSLLFLSAGGQAPGIFRHFQGVTDSLGNATAKVNIPGNLPPGLGITVFVAGATYDAKGFRTVTNTHWFVLN